MCGEGCCMMPRRDEHSHSRRRRFFTKEEKIKQLEGYTSELKTEIKAVEQMISEMKS